MAKPLKKYLSGEGEPLGCPPKSNRKVLSNVGYVVGRVIGHGTYSKVFMAEDGLGQKFACKMIDKKKAGSDFIQRFLPRELECNSIIANLKHPNIVTVYRILEINSVIYMLMDFCKNGDLLEYIKMNGPFTECNAKLIFRQIVDAIHYLHNLHIAHRDLKCENVLLMDNLVIKLADFGFARTCIDDKGKMNLSNTFCGSAAYAAPEILQGIAYEPKKYDMWALGCILYIMIVASMPFDDTNIKRMIKAQTSYTIYKMILLLPDFSSELKKILKSLLEPDSNKRASIKQVVKCTWLEESHFSKFKRFLTENAFF